MCSVQCIYICICTLYAVYNNMRAHIQTHTSTRRKGVSEVHCISDIVYPRHKAKKNFMEAWVLERSVLGLRPVSEERRRASAAVFAALQFLLRQILHSHGQTLC
jgi:hypothetical protein